MARGLTDKAYKRKKIAIGVAFFSGFAMIGAGFALFLISMSTSAIKGGGIIVSPLHEKELTLTVNDLNSDGYLSSNSIDYSFKFEPKEVDDSPISAYDSDKENLGFDISGSLYPYSRMRSFEYRLDIINSDGDIDKEAEMAFAKAAGYDSSFEGDSISLARNEEYAEYITLPSMFGTYSEIKETPTYLPMPEDGRRVIVDKSEDTCSWSLPIYFGWGSRWGNENPAVYYSSSGAGASSALEAPTALEAFHSILVSNSENTNSYESMTFRIEVKATTTGS